MKRFQILDHPADIGIMVFGNSSKELFVNAALGTTSLITEINDISADIKKDLSIKGTNIEDLFTKWLDEIIFLFDTEGFLINDIVVETCSDISLMATLKGEKYNKEKHKIKLYLKAATYHQLEIKQLKNQSWEAKVYFDV